ncbi:integrase [Peribacillus frigoritolerans]|uniref:integrase n=1 Tax=Peribacillus frigoritolerans TaxID=450367 RepID=UPI0022821BFB|nr:integrase [Peribacillus frigoritolerans]MCY9005719.1 integrase [Peribacillus frigoritolerans]
MSSIDNKFGESVTSNSLRESVNSLSPISTDNEVFKQQLRQKVHQYGDFKFEDDEWYYKKLHRTSEPKGRCTIKFGNYSQEFIEQLKYYALMAGENVKTVKATIYNMNCFLEFFRDNFPDFTLLFLNRKIINQYETFLRENVSKSNIVKNKRYKALKDFLKVMSKFPEFPNEIPTKNKNPFPYKPADNSGKYIPTDVVKQFDKIMKDKTHEIPDSLRLAYWLQRSFPNRITEVTSIPIDCIKSLYNMWVIHIPSRKQNGGYISDEIKTIPVINSGHGKYIIDLIKRVQEQTKESLELYRVDNQHKDFLILCPVIRLNINNGKIVSYNAAETYRKLLDFRNMFPTDTLRQLSEKLTQSGYPIKESVICKRLNQGISGIYATLLCISNCRFNSLLNRIAELCRITDEKGKIFKFTSHQFRHNASTDRLYIGGFTMDQLMTLRNDKGTTMPNTYIHQQKQMHKKMWMESTGLKSPTDAPVSFQARIFNLDDKKIIERLSKDSRTYLTWETNSKKGVGLCSMISGCKPNGTSIHFECYECNWFVPKAEYYEDYKKELDYWNGIMEESTGQLKRAATFENAMRNVNCLERIVEICENGIERYKKELEQKVMSSEELKWLDIMKGKESTRIKCVQRPLNKLKMQ